MLFYARHMFECHVEIIMNFVHFKLMLINHVHYCSKVWGPFCWLLISIWAPNQHIRMILDHVILKTRRMSAENSYYLSYYPQTFEWLCRGFCFVLSHTNTLPKRNDLLIRGCAFITRDFMGVISVVYKFNSKIRRLLKYIFEQWPECGYLVLWDFKLILLFLRFSAHLQYSWFMKL